RKHAAIAEIKTRFAHLRAGLPIPDAEVEAIAVAEEWRVYNLLAEHHRDYQDDLVKLAQTAYLDRTVFGGDSSNPLLPGKVTTDSYAAGLLRQRGHAVDAASIERVSGAILKAQQSALMRVDKGLKPPPSPDRSPAKREGQNFSQLVALYLAHPDSK